MENNKFYDAYGNEVIFTETDFNLTQSDETIHDEKFQTKRTTFAKDAFKRFCKNKSSVVAAYIIGLLMLLSFILPIVITHDTTERSHPEQALLPPKLFDAGTGWWDGTVKYENKVWDIETDRLADQNMVMSAVHMDTLKLTKEGQYFTDTVVPGAYGGTYVYMVDKLTGVEGEATTAKIYNYHAINKLERSKNVSITFDFVNENNLFKGQLGEYKFFIEEEKRVTETLEDGTTQTVRKYVETYKDAEFSTDYTTRTFDISQIMQDLGIYSLSKVRVGLEVKKSDKCDKYVAFNAIKLTNDDEKVQATLDELSFDNAAKQVGLQPVGSEYPAGYWQAVGTRKIHKANIIYASFTYDPYVAKLGDKTKNEDLGTIIKYIENGWLKVTDLNGKEVIEKNKDNGRYEFTNLSDFEKVGNSEILDGSKLKVEVLSDKCPLVNIQYAKVLKMYGETLNDVEYVYEVTTTTTMYKYYGYSSMPRFLLGTTELGYDLIKLSFESLRTSLLLALIVAAINFSIGLVWGATSGYYGGNVDLFMERISDILGYIPGTVVVTLCILHLGNSVLTFGIALCLTGWLGVAGRTRTQFYRYKGREYVLASRTLGAKDSRLIFKHILPNALGTIVTSAILMIPGVIFSEASLSYLGLGIKGTRSFGVLLSDNQQYLGTHPALILFPAIIISLLMISFNLFGNGLRDALNPSLKGSE